MTDQAWETLSNQAIAAAGIVYFLSLLAYLVQWASLRNVPVGRTASRKVAVGAGGLEDETTDEPVEATSRRADMTGRLGLILAGLACSAAPGVAASAAGWPRTRTGCPGATCTSSRSRGPSWSR